MEQRVGIDVAASPERVWDVLVDVERWPEWTDSVSSVRVLDPGTSFTWEQRQPGSSVSAHHECAPLADGGTRVELRVVMGGAVGGVVGRLYRRLTERYLAMEAAGLKARAEGTR